MPKLSPRILRMLAESMAEAPTASGGRGARLAADMLKGLTESPKLTDILAQVRGKLGSSEAGIADALQEAVLAALEGRKLPKVVQAAREAQGIATGKKMLSGAEDILERGQLAAELPSQFGAGEGSRGLMAKAKEIYASLSARDKALLDKAQAGTLSGSDRVALQRLREKLGTYEGTKKAPIEAEPEITPSPVRRYGQPELPGLEGPKPTPLSKEEVRARAKSTTEPFSVEETIPTYEKIMKSQPAIPQPLTGQAELPLDLPQPPLPRGAPRGYAQASPGFMQEVERLANIIRSYLP